MGLLTDLAGGGIGDQVKKAIKKKKKTDADKKSSAQSDGSAAAASGDDPLMHKGGKVRETRSYRLRKGEHVLTAKQYKRRVKSRRK
jgi:hypothetical protein